MARVYIKNGYRGKVITGEEFWSVGEREVTDQQADYLVTNGHAQYLTTSSAEARRNPALQRFVGKDESVAVSIDNVFATLEDKTDSQLIELGSLNGIVIPRTATREQAILALLRVLVRPDAVLTLTPAPKGAAHNDLLPRNEVDRVFVDPTQNGTLPSPQERDRLLARGKQPLSDLEYSALSTEEKLAYEQARGTSERHGVDFDYDSMTHAELKTEAAQRNLSFKGNASKEDLIALLKNGK